MNKNLEKIINDSLITDNNEGSQLEDSWLYCIQSEFTDDNEGLTEREFFADKFLSFFPLDCEQFTEDELVELENIAFRIAFSYVK